MTTKWIRPSLERAAIHVQQRESLFEVETMIRGPQSIQRDYKIGDRIRVRARFTHLYPAESGVIVGIVADSMRATFNEYVVEFPDHSSGSLFQFQIIRVESKPNESIQSRSA